MCCGDDLLSAWYCSVMAISIYIYYYISYRYIPKYWNCRRLEKFCKIPKNYDCVWHVTRVPRALARLSPNSLPQAIYENVISLCKHTHVISALYLHGHHGLFWRRDNASGRDSKLSLLGERKKKKNVTDKKHFLEPETWYNNIIPQEKKKYYVPYKWPEISFPDPTSSYI